MASTNLTNWHIDRARETNRIMENRESIDGHEAGSDAWYAYLTGRMSAHIEGLTDLLATTLPTCTCNPERPGDCRSFGCDPDCEVC